MRQKFEIVGHIFGYERLTTAFWLSTLLLFVNTTTKQPVEGAAGGSCAV